MSDTMTVHITLGGRVPRLLVPELCAVIRSQSVALDWDQEWFQPEAEQDLLNACASADGPTPLFLCDHCAPWGEFRELQEFLVQHQLPFDRQHDAKFEFSSELLCFRPEMGSFHFLTNSDERIVVLAENLLPAVELLKQVQRHLLRGATQDAEALVRHCLATLKEHLPRDLPAVPPLEIVAS
jgi:hypothetical protein